MKNPRELFLSACRKIGGELLPITPVLLLVCALLSLSASAGRRRSVHRSGR